MKVLYKMNNRSKVYSPYRARIQQGSPKQHRLMQLKNKKQSSLSKAYGEVPISTMVANTNQRLSVISQKEGSTWNCAIAASAKITSLCGLNTVECASDVLVHSTITVRGSGTASANATRSISIFTYGSSWDFLFALSCWLSDLFKTVKISYSATCVLY